MAFVRNHVVSGDFIKACRDYFYLVDRHYPERGSLKLVGDRYRLTGDQRTVLYRGITSKNRADIRRQLLTHHIENRKLMVDGYNVLFSLINYRFGKFLFISTDGFLRDAGSLHGKLKEYDTLNSCIEMMINYISFHKPAELEVYLDSPVSYSEKHARIIRDYLVQKGIKGDCIVIRSADWALRHGTDCILATSDTGIIEKARLPVTDLPAAILEAEYKPGFLDLNELLASEEAQDSIDES